MTIMTTAPAPVTLACEPARAAARATPPVESLAVLAARLAGTLDASVQRFLNATDQNLGYLEVQALHDVQALLRETLRRAAQAQADATPPRCPGCGQPLSRGSAGPARTFQTRCGEITLQRARGYCKRCRQWRTPADTALGLEDTAGYSPGVQALVALAASKLPIADASLVLEHLSGVKVPPATRDRESHAARASAPKPCAPNSINQPPRKNGHSNSSSNPTR